VPAGDDDVASVSVHEHQAEHLVDAGRQREALPAKGPQHPLERLDVSLQRSRRQSIRDLGPGQLWDAMSRPMASLHTVGSCSAPGPAPS
jgi:hypothetical protein